MKNGGVGYRAVVGELVVCVSVCAYVCVSVCVHVCAHAGPSDEL